MRPLRIERYGDRPSLPADVALCAAVVRLAMRDALGKKEEFKSDALDFLHSFLDGAPPDLVAAYQTGEINLQYICPWDRPEFLRNSKHGKHIGEHQPALPKGIG